MDNNVVSTNLTTLNPDVNAALGKLLVVNVLRVAISLLTLTLLKVILLVIGSKYAASNSSSHNTISNNKCVDSGKCVGGDKCGR